MVKDLSANFGIAFQSAKKPTSPHALRALSIRELERLSQEISIIIHLDHLNE